MDTAVEQSRSPAVGVAGSPGPQRVRDLFERYVVPSYGRFDIVLERGEGSYVWDSDMRRYLDFGAGIAVCALGHAHPTTVQAWKRRKACGPSCQ